MATTKATFTLDDEALGALNRVAARQHKPKSEVVREALIRHAESSDRVPADEIKRRVDFLEQMMRTRTPRPRAEVEAELTELRLSRRQGGRPGNR